MRRPKRKGVATLERSPIRRDLLCRYGVPRYLGSSKRAGATQEWSYGLSSFFDSLGEIWRIFVFHRAIDWYQGQTELWRRASGRRTEIRPKDDGQMVGKKNNVKKGKIVLLHSERKAKTR